MEVTSVRRLVWAGVSVGAVTAAWLLGLLWAGAVFLVRTITIAEPPEDAPRVPDVELAQLGWLLAGLFVAGPLLIAGLARLLRIDGAARAYLIVCGVTVLPALFFGWLSWTETHPRRPPEPPWTPPSHCVAYSGGSNSCPGG